MNRLSAVITTSVAVLSTSLLIAQVIAGNVQSQRVPQFENEDVKVWKSTVLPNQPLAMHHHDHPRVIVALAGGTMNLVDSTGATESHHWETGKAYWLPAMPAGAMHSDVNAGGKPMEVMVIELEKEK